MSPPPGQGAVAPSDQRLRLMVVDDHPMWREALRADLERAGVGDVVAEASDGGEAVVVARGAGAQVVLMDLNLPTMSGVEATRRIVEAVPGARVLVLSASGEETDVLEAIKAGATGYLMKSATSAEVEEAVRRVARGEPVFTPSLAGVVLEEFRQLATRRNSRTVLPQRENEVLRLVAKGYTYQEIAQRLSISGSTVRNYMQNILTRLHLRHEDALLDREDEEALPAGDDRAQGQRVLATVLFTDIVGSTEHAARIGDQRWRDLLESHHAVVRRELARFRGKEIDTAGDGFLITFEEPAQAVRCAAAIVEAVPRLGLEVRAGLHTGEVERVGEAVRGIAIHIGARVAAAARPGEVLVSGTVRDLVTGSGLGFTDVGTRTLKGVPGEWRLFALDQEASGG